MVDRVGSEEAEVRLCMYLRVHLRVRLHVRARVILCTIVCTIGFVPCVPFCVASPLHALH